MHGWWPSFQRLHKITRNIDDKKQCGLEFYSLQIDGFENLHGIVILLILRDCTFQNMLLLSIKMIKAIDVMRTIINFSIQNEPQEHHILGVFCSRMLQM